MLFHTTVTLLRSTPNAVYLTKIGLSKSDSYVVIRVYPNNITVYFEGDSSISHPLHTLNGTYTNLDYYVGFYVIKNIVYLRCLIMSGTSVVIDITEESNKVSSISNWVPFFETLIVQGSISNNFDYIQYSNTHITYDLKKRELDDIFTTTESTNTYNLINDLDDEGTDLDVIALPLNYIEGHILTLDNQPKSSLIMNSIDTNNSNLPSISYRVSTLYNKNKSDFYYKPTNNWIFPTGESEILTIPSACVLPTHTISFSNNGLEYDGSDYYSLTYPTQDPNKYINSIWSNSISDVILIGQCYEIPTNTSNTSTIIHKLVIKNNLVNTNNVTIDVDGVAGVQYYDQPIYTQLSYSVENGNDYLTNMNFNFVKPISNQAMSYFFSEPIGTNIGDIVQYSIDHNLPMAYIIQNGITFTFTNPLEVSDINYSVGSVNVYITNVKYNNSLPNSWRSTIANTFTKKLNGLVSSAYQENNIIYTKKYYDYSGNVVSSNSNNIAKTTYIINSIYVPLSMSYGDILLEQISTYTTSINFPNGVDVSDPGSNYINNGIIFEFTNPDFKNLTYTISNLNPSYNLIIYNPIYDTTITTTYTKLALPTTPSSELFKSNYVINPTYKILSSEYLDTYKDSPINISGWKLFNYYQLPINI